MSSILSVARGGLTASWKEAIDLMSLTEQSGTSGATTFVVNGCLKIGPQEVISEQVEAYRTMVRSLGGIDSQMLPAFRQVELGGGLGMLITEYVPGATLEDMCLVLLDLAQYLPKDHALVLRQQDTISRAVRACLSQMNFMYGQTCREDVADGGAFLNECLAALSVNCRQAGLEPLLDELPKLNQRKSDLLECWQSSACLKDCSAVNIRVDVSQEPVRVRFIDPRQAIPYCTEVISNGSIVADLAALDISLRRRQLELMHVGGADVGLAALKELRALRAGLIHEGAFTESMYTLCCAVYYSVYAACRCRYCTAPERVWLLEEMQRQTGHLIVSLTEM